MSWSFNNGVCSVAGPVPVPRLEPSPTSSCEGTWANWAREMSVGDRMGPGLAEGAIPTVELVRALLASW